MTVNGPNPKRSCASEFVTITDISTMHRRGSTVLILAFTTLFFKSVTATGYEQTFCTDLRPQISVDISQIMGMWYGVEVIPHLKEDVYSSIDTCPVIHLSEISYEVCKYNTLHILKCFHYCEM